MYLAANSVINRMLYEATIKFLDKKPFIFYNKADVPLMEKGKPYDLLANVVDGKLTLLRNENTPLCILYTENYECGKINDT